MTACCNACAAKPASTSAARGRARQSVSILVETVPLAELQRAAPTAACIARPNVSSWQDFRARRTDPGTAWTSLTRRTQIAVFLPNDESPQEIRDCLHEEIAQALGPVNDLFRLNNSIFNDDNFHSVLTGYDMLILRAYYDPALRSGMSPAQVAERLPAVLSRLNPCVEAAASRPPPEQLAWKSAITDAMDKRTPRTRRRLAAERAVSQAAVNGGTRAQLALSYYWLGRLSMRVRSTKARWTPSRPPDGFTAKAPGFELQSARVALQIAAFQLSIERPDVSPSGWSMKTSARRVGAKTPCFCRFSCWSRPKPSPFKGKPPTAPASSAKHSPGRATALEATSEVRERASEILAISPRSKPARGAA